MTISTYISDLLYRYECVILPGFGAFLTQNLPACIDEKTNTFFPPSKVIAFNRQLQTNDGLLANYVASVQKCSYEVALHQLRHFSAETLEKIQKEEVISFKNIGEFSKTAEGTILFKPFSGQNFDTAAFGLSSFISHTIEREANKASKKPFIKTVALHPETSKKKLPYFKYAAVATIALLASGFIGLNIYENRIDQQNLTERQKATDLIENRIQEATFIIKNPLPAINLNVSRHSGNYHIVAGAFREEDNAKKLMEELRTRGYSPRKLTSRHGLHQIFYQSFGNRKDALETLNKIRASENKNAWLLVQELE